MSETPEKRVLKEMLTKLKAKIIASQKGYFGLSTSMLEGMTDTTKACLEGTMKMPEGQAKDRALMLTSLIQSWMQNINLLNTTTTNLIVDMSIYIDTLESYSTKLDNTLTDIFQRARKMAEEEEKRREELRKRKPSDMIA